MQLRLRGIKWWAILHPAAALHWLCLACWPSIITGHLWRLMKTGLNGDAGLRIYSIDLLYGRTSVALGGGGGHLRVYHVILCPAKLYPILWTLLLSVHHPPEPEKFDLSIKDSFVVLCAHAFHWPPSRWHTPAHAHQRSTCPTTPSNQPDSRKMKIRSQKPNWIGITSLTSSNVGSTWPPRSQNTIFAFSISSLPTARKRVHDESFNDECKQHDIYYYYYYYFGSGVIFSVSMRVSWSQWETYYWARR